MRIQSVTTTFRPINFGDSIAYTLITPAMVKSEKEKNNGGDGEAVMKQLHHAAEFAKYGMKFDADSSLVASETLVRVARRMGIEEGSKKETIDKLVERLKRDKEVYRSGECAETRVIPGTKYILKTPKKGSDFESMKDTRLSKKDRFNNVVLNGKNYKILNRIEGVDLSAAYSEGTMDTFLEIAAAMPQSAFDDFVVKMGEVHRAGLLMDTLGRNLIIDIDHKKFVPIDYLTFEEELLAPGYRMGFSADGKIFIDPFECALRSVKMDKNSKYYTEFLRKTMRAIANDFQYFEYFDTVGASHYAKRQDRDTFLAMLKLETLQDTKKRLLRQGKSKTEIEAMLSIPAREIEKREFNKKEIN